MHDTYIPFFCDGAGASIIQHQHTGLAVIVSCAAACMQAC
jgi:hypothetical protein